MISYILEAHSKIHLIQKQINILKNVFIKFHKAIILIKYSLKMNIQYKRIIK